MVLGQVPECKKYAVSKLRTRYDIYASFKILAKILHQGNIREVLNFWKCSQELVLECHKCPLLSDTFQTTFIASKQMLGATNQFS